MDSDETREPGWFQAFICIGALASLVGAFWAIIGLIAWAVQTFGGG